MIVKFKKRPPKDVIRTILEDFLSDTGDVAWDRDRFMVDLPGKSSYAVKSIFPECDQFAGRIYVRWIEVWFDKTSIDFIVRRGDDFTIAIAKGMAETFARVFEGTMEE